MTIIIIIIIIIIISATLSPCFVLRHITAREKNR